MIKMRVEGVQELNEALRRYGDRAETAIGRAVNATALEVLTDIKKRIQRGPKTGHVYESIFRMIGGRPVPVGPRSGNNLSATHQASAPGEAPATDTGTLANSVTFNRVDPLNAEVESRLPYAAMLEFGTVRIDPRPAWQPAVDAAAPKLQRRVTTAIEGLE